MYVNNALINKTKRDPRNINSGYPGLKGLGREGQAGGDWANEDKDRREIFHYTQFYARIFTSESCDCIAFSKTELQFFQSQTQRRASCTGSAGPARSNGGFLWVGSRHERLKGGGGGEDEKSDPTRVAGRRPALSSRPRSQHSGASCHMLEKQ